MIEAYELVKTASQPPVTLHGKVYIAEGRIQRARAQQLTTAYVSNVKTRMARAVPHGRMAA